MARGSAPRDGLVLHCECRRPATFERGMIKWSFALLILGAAALDAFWVMPAQREARARARAAEPYVRIATVEAHAPLADALSEMKEEHGAPLLVIENGRLAGMLTTENVGEYFMIRSSLEKHRPHRPPPLIRAASPVRE